MKKIMNLVVLIGLALLMAACSDDDSTTTPSVVSVTGVTLNKKTLSMTVGGTETLSVVVSPANATNKRVAWSSSKTEVASVDNQGVVTAHKAGDAVITVKSEDGGKTDACSVTVAAQAVAVTGVKLDKNEQTVTVGDSITLVATVAPDNATNKKVTWKSDKADIATVDANGKVTGVKAGTATITVTTEDGNKTATCKIAVKDAVVKVTGVKLDKNEQTVTVGSSITLVATVAPDNATNKKVTWKSDKADIATVDANGKVTGVKAGTATITVTTEDGNKTATCKVTVQAATVAVTSVGLNKTDITLTEGSTFQFVATVAPANATNKKVTWKSSNTSVVDIDSNGLAGALKEGTATITTTTEDGGFKAYCKVTVQAATIAVKAVSLNKVETTLYVGGKETLIATISPSNATNKEVTWNSSKSSVASVDKNGTVTAKSEGSAIISVVTDDGKLTASCLVTVEEAPSSTISGKGYENLGTW